MKSNNERTRYILETSEKRLAEKRTKRKKAEKFIAGTFCMCAVLALSVRFYSTDLLQPFPDADVIENPPETTLSSLSTSSSYKTVPTTTVTHPTEKITAQTTEKIPETSSETVLTNTEATVTEPVLQTETTRQSEQPTTITTSAEIPDEQTTTTLNDNTEQPSYEHPLPWEELPINQQYFMCDYDGNEYQTEKQEVSAENIGGLIGTGFMSGWDSFTDTYYHCDAEIFSIADKDSVHYIAVKFIDDDRFYIYKNCILFTGDSMTDITD